LSGDDCDAKGAAFGAFRDLTGLELIEGAVDLHVHSYPELGLALPAACDDLTLIRLAQAYGLAGVVLKSVVFPTASVAHYLNRVQSGVQVIGSITLNEVVGGVCATSVELAARQGARMVWFPHWSAANDQQNMGFSRHTLFPRVPRAASLPAIRVTTDDGSLTKSASEVLEVIREYGLAFASGHVDPRESLALFKAARAMGVRSYILTHPLHGQIRADTSLQLAAVELGAMIEHVMLGCMPTSWRIDPKDMLAAITAVGFDHVVISSDAWRAHNPPGPELLRMAGLTFLELGVSPANVRKMVVDNPRRVVELDGM